MANAATDGCPLSRQLGRYVRLTEHEASILGALALHRRTLHTDEVLIRAGDGPVYAFLVLQGFVYRYKLLADGHRQILAILLPGSLCGLEAAAGELSDHSVAAMGEAVVSRVPLSQLAAIRDEYPNIDRALSLASAAERSILRHWLLNVGQRGSVQRISHFLCEIASRLKSHGETGTEEPIKLPFSQVMLADTTGVTTVHVNRVLQHLRREGLIALRRQEVAILKPDRLAELAGFDEDYLTAGTTPPGGGSG